MSVYLFQFRVGVSLVCSRVLCQKRNVEPAAGFKTTIEMCILCGVVVCPTCPSSAWLTKFPTVYWSDMAAHGNALATPATPPKIDTIQDGYRFRGGDPADPKNWSKVQ